MAEKVLFGKLHSKKKKMLKYCRKAIIIGFTILTIIDQGVFDESMRST